MKNTKTDWDKIDAMADDDIDYSDNPEITEDFFKIAFIRKPTRKELLIGLNMMLMKILLNFLKKIMRNIKLK